MNVSNKLKNAFDASPSAVTVVEHPINARLLFCGVTVHVTKMVNIKTPNKTYPNMTDDNVRIHFTVSNEKGTREKILPQRSGVWFDFMKHLIRLYNPMEMTINDSDDLSNTFLYKDFSEVVTELIKVDGDSDDDDESDCCGAGKTFKKLNEFHFRVCDAFDEECRRQQKTSEDKIRLAEVMGGLNGAPALAYLG